MTDTKDGTSLVAALKHGYLGIYFPQAEGGHFSRTAYKMSVQIIGTVWQQAGGAYRHV